MNRRCFLKRCAGTAGGLVLSRCRSAAAVVLSNRAVRIEMASNRPNVVLCMADDLGWGDVGYNGHPVIKTPNLDDMASKGIRFDRWYSGAPVCSPTRGSCITGRHPYRYGVFFANTGHMRSEEVTLAEALKARGYLTGHFGKWHLGTLTTEIRDSNRGRPGATKHYSPPWENGFDVCFSTEAKVPTWDPMKSPGSEGFYGTYYWRQDGNYVPIDSPELTGDDSRVIADQAIRFFRKAVAAKRPFLAVIWFHAPHKPFIAGPEYRAMYPDCSSSEQDYYGCITAMDEQVGRLRRELEKLGVSGNTMFWFSSDNGPENGTPGLTGGFRERKRSLYEGGVRVPGLLEWPGRIKRPTVVKMPCCTSDYFPTVMDVLGFEMEGQPKPIDGVSLLPVIEGKMSERPVPIGFESGNRKSLTDNRYKLISTDGGSTFELYDLVVDPYERTDIASSHAEIVASMKATLAAWEASCDNSLAGADY